jgi:hypothetical protein
MSSGEVYEMFLAPAWVVTPAQWAGWWLVSKLRGPLLTMQDLGLDVVRPAFDPSAPRWSFQDLGEVTGEQIDRFAAAVEQAIQAVTDQGGTAELTIQRGRSTLLADVAAAAGIPKALLPRIAGPYRITVSATQARMRPFLQLDPMTHFTGDESAGWPLPDDAPETVMWPRAAADKAAG